MLTSPILRTLLLIFFVYLSSFLLLKYYGKKGVQWLALMIGGLGILFQLLVNGQEKFGILGFGFVSLKEYLQVIMTVVDILLLVFIVGNITGLLKIGFEWDIRVFGRTLVRMITQTVQGGLIAVFTEELVFRGLVQRQLALSLSPVLAILIASVVFGIWHMPVGRLILGFEWRKTVLYGIGTGLIGTVFGIFYARSGSLIVAGFAHGFWNAIVYLLWGLGGLMPNLLESKNDALTHPEYGVIGVGALAIAVPIMAIVL